MRSGLRTIPGIVAVVLLVGGIADARETYEDVLSVIPDGYVTIVGTGSFDAFVDGFLGKGSKLAEVEEASPTVTVKVS